MNATAQPRLVEHVPGDWAALRALWALAPPGRLGLSNADEERPIGDFLRRNPGLSFGAWLEGELAGSILAGSDGRRGYLHHLMVRPDVQRQGLGRLLVERSSAALAGQGIRKVHVFVYAANREAAGFWSGLGFVLRSELEVFSREIG
jgi:putative acetyltransferase